MLKLQPPQGADAVTCATAAGGSTCVLIAGEITAMPWVVTLALLIAVIGPSIWLTWERAITETKLERAARARSNVPRSQASGEGTSAATPE